MDDTLALLGKAAASIRIDTLPGVVIQRAKQRILDTVACLVAGYNAGIAEPIRSYVQAQGGTPEATVLPTGAKTTAALACLAHATYIHGLELSDGVTRDVVRIGQETEATGQESSGAATAHPGNEIVPAALALTERASLTGGEFVAAVTAAYEIEIRIGRAVCPGAAYRGWWVPGLLGGVGSAVTAGHLLKPDEATLANAIGIVLNLLPTSMARANAEYASVKWLIGGHACATGLLAAEMAARGVNGLRDIRKGWLPAISEQNYPKRLTQGIAQDGRITDWELLNGILTKYYATVGPIASALDAIFALTTWHDIRSNDIVEIQVECTQRTGMFNIVHPDNEIAARASLPYCIAVAVCTRDPGQLLGPGFRSETLKDAAVYATAEKVRIIHNPAFELEHKTRSKVRINVLMHNGKSYSAVDDRSAHARYLTPTDEDIEGKFRSIAASVIGKGNTEKVIMLVRNLERLPNVNELIAALRVGP